MQDPISAFIVSTLTGVAVNFLSLISKKAVKGLKALFSEDELKSVLNQAFLEFKESYIKEDGSKDEKVLLEVFNEFFSDEKTMSELFRSCHLPSAT